ncbi:COG1470 family protein [Cellulomonas dongxiuzhuiae]|uniref:DUF916 domain-containing protein n=1 Tax=Cellulomonas dongxiuzhuiae TaxID=2819979 RepID=A0ABX8GK06_9CELL|nr:hypothetical protein [Cellulomonas dongxiuzhuiae]MBO3095180.1 hypothetical protein [Cellulomonas dongxiuzhuiae]QWC16183.1 DUF916 domain-containing protein [Cellulomonas dongxiuzhuiae]
MEGSPVRIPIRCTVVAALVALVGGLVAGPAAGSTSDEAAPDAGATVTWTVQPATADGPDGRISLRHVLDPGASVTDHVAITNFSERSATFAVYAGDGVVSDSGHFDLPPGDSSAQDGGAWLTLGDVPGAERVDDGTLRLTLDPGAAVTVPLAITVPADATPGDHPAGVVAELVSGDTVRLAARVGTRLHLRVTGDVVASLAPQDVTTRWEPSWNPFAPGTVHVRYRVANTGDVRLAARAATTLAGPFGAGAAEHAVDVREVLPGQSALVEAELEVWPVVRVAGHVDARPWVVGEDVVDAALRTGSAQVAVWVVPWSQLALLVLVVGGVLGVRWGRRRSARRVQARIDAALAEAGVAREPASTTQP